MRENSLDQVFKKTQGHCHFCGDPLTFENRGWADEPSGHWEVDHVIQRNKGGSKKVDNCLPACTGCNRLRWHRTGEATRKRLLLGVIAADEIKKNTSTGLELTRLWKRRLVKNETRRVARKALAATQGS
jgi:5-methylcytosine-specific restriction endonuclease McrA